MLTGTERTRTRPVNAAFIWVREERLTIQPWGSSYVHAYVAKGKEKYNFVIEQTHQYNYGITQQH